MPRLLNLLLNKVKFSQQLTCNLLSPSPDVLSGLFYCYKSRIGADRWNMANRIPFYVKVIQGCVEQTFDSAGYCIKQEFIAFDDNVDRRIIKPEGEKVGEDELENDELIENEEDLEYINSIEKHVDIVLAQPPPPPEE